MSLDRKRWALLAQDLKFSQLDIARKQADTWRTGLATLTTLLTGVLVVKGRDDVSALTLPFQVLVAALLGLALVLLLWATIWVSRALAGPPGEEIMLTGEGLEQWTYDEVGKISKALRWVPQLAVASILAVAGAVALTWFAPDQHTSTAPFVQVTDPSGQSCGELVGASDHEMVIRTATSTTLIPLSDIDTIITVTACG
ncbi:MAG TPA: hypothetical protein VN969_30635 [Streptosporangiaceae bacterium]|nr:hypothetical protein [Streptosporangiaceae bacterium]